MTKKKLLILVLAIIIAGVAYYAYQNGYFEARRTAKSTLSALEIARISNDFIENRVINMERRGYGDFWRPYFFCKKERCVADIIIKDGELFSTYFLPVLHIQNLRLLASVTKDPEIKKREIAETLYLVQICRINLDVCRRSFSAIVNSDVDYKFDVSTFGAFLINDFGLKPQNLVTWIQKLERFVLFARVTKKEGDISRAKQIFAEGDAFFKRASEVVYKEGDSTVTRASCFEPLGRMKLYSLTKDQSDLNVAKDFVSLAGSGGHARDFNNPALLDDAIIHPALVCGELLAQLYSETKDEKYKIELKILMQHLILKSVDFAENPVANGSGAFTRNFRKKGIQVKHAIDTLWFEHIMLQIPDETFSVPF